MSVHLGAGHRYESIVLRLRAGDEIVLADSGTGERGPVVLAVPGWKGSDLGLRAVCAPLVRRGHRVVTLNLPGMGISPSVAGRRYDMDTLIDLVNEVVDSLYATTGPLILVGHSFGATLVAAVAGRRNHKVRGVVFVSPVVIPASKRRQPTERLSWLAIRYAASLLSRLPLGFAQRMIRLQAVDVLATATLARRGRSGFRRIREASRPERSLVPDPSAVADQMLAAACYGCLESATKVDTPSWIIAGTADAMSTVEDLHRLQGALNARLELIPGGGHLAHHEDADEVREALERAVAALA